MSSPTQRSKALLERDGYLVAIAESWVPFPPPGHRRDLFGWIDLVAISGDLTLAIQTTSRANMSARIKKMKALQSWQVWTESPNRKAVVHGWFKQGNRWQVKTVLVEPITTQPETHRHD